MNKQDWLEQARQHNSELRSLIIHFHPSYPGQSEAVKEMKITAPNVEGARLHVVDHILANDDLPTNPVQEFDAGLAKGDVGTVYSILNKTWFGVPESTDCWGLKGFAEAVDLLEDPPEE